MKKLAANPDNSQTRPGSGVILADEVIRRRRDFARELLENARQHKPVELSKLLKLHEEKDMMTRASLVETTSFLVMAGKHTKHLVPVLAKCLDSSSPSERQHAMRAIAHYAKEGGNISQYAQIIASKRLCDIHADVRFDASQALQTYMNAENAVQVLGYLPERTMFSDATELETVRTICRKFTDA